MQRITTKEPDDSQIEVAITSLKAALPDVFTDFIYVDPHDVSSNAENSSDKAENDASINTADGI